MKGVQDEYDTEEYDDKSAKSIPLHDNDAFDDIYSHYTSPTESPASTRSAYYTQHTHPQRTLQRNHSDYDQSVYTPSSRWDNAMSSKGNLDDSQSDFKKRHFAADPSISKRTVGISSPKAKRFSWLPQTWATRLFLLLTLFEAAADVSIESMLLYRYRSLQGNIVETDGNISALPVFVMVFGMAHVYQCLLAVDAVANRNSILVFGLVVFNSAL
jgi:hypothetical protein